MQARKWGMTARKLLKDFASGRGSIVASPDLNSWLVNAGLCSPRVSMDIVRWVIENIYQKSKLHQKSKFSPPKSYFNTFLDATELIYDLAKWVSTVKGEGIPDELRDNFPGLNRKVMSFRVGEIDRAQSWLQGWLIENVEGFVKICDPYFGPEELVYLKHIPIDCRVLLVTTSKCLDVEEGPEKLKENLESYWKSNISSRSLPSIQLLIIPKELDDKFHDRAIITSRGGLDIGPSLNGLGKSFQKITILTQEDASDLERTYVNDMLNNATWFMQGIKPTVIFLGS